MFPFTFLKRVSCFSKNATRSFSSQVNLTPYHINNKNIIHNLPYKTIYECEMRETAKTTNLGANCISTGIYTGRSPKDKYFVRQEPSSKNLWWGSVNQPISKNIFDEIHKDIKKHYSKGEKIYVFDGYAGSNKKNRKRIRFLTEYIWQHHFVKNMFIEAKQEELHEFENKEDIDFTIINACNMKNSSYEKYNMNSDVFVLFNIEDRMALIGGTHYGGEMKKGIFSMMNYWLPLQNIMSMHCSANIDDKGDTALFFGLSGTGKTTLSVDKDRKLIGDDQHGWDDEGIFNFEGGCYAKTINLSQENEPEIYNAIKKNALLENVFLDKNNTIDFADTSITENGRVSYPLEHIEHRQKNAQGTHPTNIFFLCCDAFGVLPPIAKLNHEQAMYYFLSGYTAKVAGTERGITEPEATFSACFGAAFLTLHPTKYADLLKEKIDKHDTNVYLVNTGWSGGKYGDGSRMTIKTTRECINSVFNETIDCNGFYQFPGFNFMVPRSIYGLPTNLMYPLETWKNKHEYIEQRKKLITMFQENYKQFQDPSMTDYSKYGPEI